MPRAVTHRTQPRRRKLLHLRMLAQLRPLPLHNHLGTIAVRTDVEAPFIFAHTSFSYTGWHALVESYETGNANSSNMERGADTC
jgi:hypothetical protein